MTRLVGCLKSFVGALIPASRSDVRDRQPCRMEPLEDRQLLSLTVDLRLPGGAKSAEVTSIGQKITMQVWAVVRGRDANGANDGLWMAAGSFLSSGSGPGGDLASAVIAPFNSTGSQNGTPQDLNGDGHLDVGSNNDPDATGFFGAVDASMNFDGTVSGATNSFLIGTLTYTVTSLDAGSTQINFRPRTVSAGIWSEDGISTSNPSNYFAGTPITLSFIAAPRIALSSKGILSVVGTSQADNIYVSSFKGRITAKVNNTSQTFSATKVKKIKIYGMAGNDTIAIGKGVMGCYIDDGAGNDTVRGGAGNDTIIANSGGDSIYGGAGDDTIYARNGARDIIDGGTGYNRAQVDKIDKLTRIQLKLK